MSVAVKGSISTHRHSCAKAALIFRGVLFVINSSVKYVTLAISLKVGFATTAMRLCWAVSSAHQTLLAWLAKAITVFLKTDARK